VTLRIIFKITTKLFWWSKIILYFTIIFSVQYYTIHLSIFPIS